jgi:hypothetical protein
MGVVNRKSVASPTLPKETVEMPGLDGEVIVCGLKLTDRLGLQNRMATRRSASDEADVGAMANVRIEALCRGPPRVRRRHAPVRLLQRGRRKKVTSQPDLRFALRLAQRIGCTLDELGHRMSAQEFGLHMALDHEEALSAPMNLMLGKLQASIANGPLKTPPGRVWRADDFVHLRPLPEAKPVEPVAEQKPPMTVEEIKARFNAAGG